MNDEDEGMAAKRLIFTVTTGRSGTQQLTRLMETVRGVTSVHEPKPHFVWAMREAQRDPSVARRFWVEQKLPAIRRTPHPVYVETNHLVCKGFLEPLLELGYLPDLVMLRRRNRAVAASMYRLGTIPGRSAKGLKWYLMPEDPGVLPLPGWEEMHDYQLCYWYTLEIERRRQVYATLFSARGAIVVDVDISDLGTVKGFRRLRRELRLPPQLLDPRAWIRLYRRTRRRANKQSLNKRPLSLPDDLDGLEAEVREKSVVAAPPRPGSTAP